MADKLTLDMVGSVLSYRSYVGKTGKTGYYVAVSWNGQPVTVFLREAPNALSFVPDPNTAGTFIPSDNVPVRVKFVFGLSSFGGKLNLDCLSFSKL